jgi:hypothetical protein
LGLPLSTVEGFITAVLGFADYFSFACYMSFLFYFFGPWCMCCSYGYVKMYQEERKIAKKYKYQHESVNMCSKNKGMKNRYDHNKSVIEEPDYKEYK